MTGLAWLAVDQLLRWPWFRSRLNGWVNQAQYRLGVGSGTNPRDSGEMLPLQALASDDRLRGRAPCIFDVGSNVGEYVALTSSILGGRRPVIHCFEPSPHAFKLLQSRFDGRDDIKLNPVGLANKTETRLLHSDEPGSALASLTRRRLDHVQLTHDHSDCVEVTTLDKYCSARGVEVIDLLKLDVEGHELDVLEGCRTMLARRAIRMIAFEFGGCNIDTRTYLRDFWYFFREQGARGFYRMMPHGHLFAIQRYEEGLETFKTCNFLVVLDDGIRVADHHASS